MQVAVVSTLKRCKSVFQCINKLSSSKLKSNFTPKVDVRCLCSSSRRYQGRPVYNGESSELYDVVIAGGGMAGRAMACALGQEPSLQNHKILLLEGAAKPEMGKLPEHYSNRVCALNPGAVDLLDSVGAWEEMVKQRVKPFCRMQVWDACSDAVITMNNDDLSEYLAYIVENNVTIEALSTQLEKLSSNVRVEYETLVTNVHIPQQNVVDEANWAEVELHNGECVKARLLIAADGANSSIRKMCGIDVLGWEYGQSGVVATLHLSEPSENNVAWQRFLPTGPIAMLPLSDTQSSLVWSITTDKAKGLMQLTDEEFVEEINNAFWDNSHHDPTIDSISQFFQGILSTISPEGSSVRQLPPSVISIDPGSRGRFPLALGHAMHYVKPRLALIGDAAHRIHPLAGQGINLGFGDVECLADKLVEAAKLGKDLGSLHHLLEYESSRQRHIIPIMAAVDGLKRLYSTDNQAVVLVRSLGLQATNAMTPLKNAFISGAST
ncbi:ubiquinone biosynthesis monooxygenase COQ6, mitochondrial-like [Amphiura filiformis]|uniref:ubiquinone biosynthesis monooxygenase COQ6, mitochondrial-like n=1 Tax=Amphiura filiformis TaxID=82378 RepID=UPI003B21E8DC